MRAKEVVRVLLEPGFVPELEAVTTRAVVENVERRFKPLEVLLEVRRQLPQDDRELSGLLERLECLEEAGRVLLEAQRRRLMWVV